MSNFYIDCPMCDGENESCYACEGDGAIAVDLNELQKYTIGHPQEAELDKLIEDDARVRKQHAELCKLKPEMAHRYKEMLDDTIAKLNKAAAELYEKR